MHRGRSVTNFAMSKYAIANLLSLALLLVPCAAYSQSVPGDFKNYVPTASPARIDAEQAPKIDGDLSDPIWAKATRLTEFYQVEPTVSLPNVQTHVYLAYDQDALYVAVEAFEPEIEDIYATIMERDGDVWRDDMVRFYIDPFDTGLTGFGFDVNALGARLDRLVQSGRRPIDEWDTIWDAAGQINAESWTAEIAIPFRSISFDPEASSWGLNITRERSHKAEEIRWAGIDQSLNTFSFARAGRLKGIQDVNQGNGFEVTLQATVRATRDWTTPRKDVLTGDPSASLLYKFTPSLSGLLTLNSDFSDTPLDSRQINTGRFSLFFPETRDFFLQDAAFFEFGGQAFNGAPNGQPFFSRRIGIVDGQAVTLEAGAKLSGELGGVEFGVLTAKMADTGGRDGEVLSVGRATYDLSKRSRIGAIATLGDPTGQTDNSLVGLDYLYQIPSFMGGGRLQGDFYVQRTFSSVSDDDDVLGLRIEYPNDRWNWKVAARQIGENFRPALGFANRLGTRDYDASWNRRFRFVNAPGAWVQFGTEHELITDLDGDLETRVTAVNGSFQTAATDAISVSAFENREIIRVPFNLPTGITVPDGEYQNDGASLSFTSSRLRPYGGTFEIEQKDFFDGSATILELEVLARPNRFIDLRASYERSDLSVPAGDVSVQIGSIDTVVNISPKISASTQTQYDNVSNNLSFFARLQWEIRPETELFLSLGHGAIIPDDDFGRNFQSIQTQSILRIGNALRF